MNPVKSRNLGAALLALLLLWLVGWPLLVTLGEALDAEDLGALVGRLGELAAEAEARAGVQPE